jgi:hypothetical protein
VGSFTVQGFNPLIDAGDPAAFPLELSFNTGAASFVMTAAAVPEPTSLFLLGQAALVLLLIQRRVRRKAARVMTR